MFPKFCKVSVALVGESGVRRQGSIGAWLGMPWWERSAVARLGESLTPKQVVRAILQFAPLSDNGGS